MAAPLPTFPPTLSSDAGDMSDVQRGALPATNMLPADRLGRRWAGTFPGTFPGTIQAADPGNMPSQFPAASSLPSANLCRLWRPRSQMNLAHQWAMVTIRLARPQTNPANLPDGRRIAAAAHHRAGEGWSAINRAIGAWTVPKTRIC